jgi:flavin reductase (DIM6/NTAB) family NADH-FMN oxidoreductase RutF
MTVNSLTSVSLQPLLLLFCARRGTLTRALVGQTKCFSVNILAHDQEHLSRAFAGQRDLCGNVEWARLGGVPVLADAEVVFACELHNEHSAGDHTIVVGEVTAMRGRSPSRAPLIFYHGHYDSLAGPKFGRSSGV